MKYSWVVIVVFGVMLICGISVLAPASYTNTQTRTLYSDDVYTNSESDSRSNEVEVDEDTPSMLLEKNPFFADPNTVKAAIQAYPELEKICTDMSARSRMEVRQWLTYKEDQDVRIMNIRAMHTQANTELQVLKKVAAADGAKRTVAMIDALLIERQARYERLAREVIVQQKKLAAAERNTNTSSRTSSRTGSRTSNRRNTNQSGRSSYQTRRR